MLSNLHLIRYFHHQEDDDRTLVQVAESIGRAIEDECQMQYYERTCPGLLKTIKDNYWHRACGTQQKLVVVRTLINRTDVTPWKAWKPDVEGEARHMAVELRYRGFWVVYTDIVGKVRRLLTMSSQLLSFSRSRTRSWQQCELFSPIAYPMLIEPNDWTNDRHGGYLLNEIRMCNDLVRRGE